LSRPSSSSKELLGSSTERTAAAGEIMMSAARIDRCIAVCLVLATMLTPFAAPARPVILTEEAKLLSPYPPNVGFYKVAIDGDHLLALAYDSRSEDYGFVVLHYRRLTSGEWTFMTEVTPTPSSGEPYGDPDIELRGNIGAVTINSGFAAIMERTTAGWRTHEVRLPGWGYSGAEIQGSTVAVGFYGNAPNSVALVRKNASGVWAIAEVLEGTLGRHDGDYVGPDHFALTDNEAMLAGNYYDSVYDNKSETQIFDRINGQWTRTQMLPWPYRPVVVDNRVALRLGGLRDPGEVETFHTRDAQGGWTGEHALLSEEFNSNHDSRHIEVRANRAFADAGMRDFGPVGAVFRRESPTRARHVATLTPSDIPAHPDGAGYSYGVHRVSSNGDRAATVMRTTLQGSAIYIYQLPATLPAPLRLQDTFQDANASGWVPYGPANWSVPSVGGSYVYRQLNTQGDGRAVLSNSEATHQSIQADMTMRSGVGTPWSGLMVRYTNPQNFYYLLVSGTSVQIRRIVNGSFQAIASAPFTRTYGRTYRFRLEAIGKRIRAFRDGQLVAEAIDASHSHGQAGLIMWKSATDYDNVIVSSNPYSPLTQDVFSGEYGDASAAWRSEPANSWAYTRLTNNTTVFRQSSTAGDARAVSGGPAVDQIVTADITPRTFATSTSWVGLMARYVDNRNYYYVVLRNGKASLRKWVNGVITVLEETTITVQANATYRVRLEAIGSSLRLYVNGRLMAEGQDSALPSGRYGLVTYRAAADFDTFSAMRP
jgi:hypothetical protein